MKLVSIEVIVGAPTQVTAQAVVQTPTPVLLSTYERARRGMLTATEQRANELAWLAGFPKSAPICTPSRAGLLGWLRG